MEINKTQAKNIIRNLNDLIYDDIYVYHPSGQLLASNNEEIDESILTYGRIVADKQEVYVGNLQEYGKKALILPVKLRGEIAAIIGLRGEYATVTQYSDLVVKMVEILLSESRYYTTKIARAEINRKIIHAFIQEEQDTEELKRISEDQHIDMDKINFLAVINPKNLMKEINLVIDSLERVLHTGVRIGEFDSQIVLLFWDKNRADVEQDLTNAQKYIYQKYGVNLSVGLSSPLLTIGGAKNAYFQANETLSIGHARGGGGIYSFEEYVLDLIFKNVDKNLLKGVINNIFSRCKKDDIDKIDRLIDTYIVCNTSLAQTSKALFIHKNTLQYRLKWVEKMTGYDPRDTNQLFKLYTVLKIIKNQ